MPRFLTLETFEKNETGERQRVLLNLDDLSEVREHSENASWIVKRSGKPDSSGLDKTSFPVPYGYDHLIGLIATETERQTCVSGQN